MNVSFFQELLGSIAERGRALIERSPDRRMADGREAPVPGAPGAAAPETLEGLCRALLSGRGEASGVALARQVLDLYAALPVPARLDFFRLLARDFGPDPARLRAAWAAYDAGPRRPGRPPGAAGAPSSRRARSCSAASTWPPAARRPWSAMREDLLGHGGKEPGLRKRRRRPRAPPLLLVQPRLPRAPPRRLVDPGRHPRAHHPLRGRARDPGLGRPAPPRAAARPALLRLLPPLAGRRAADLRRGGADPRGPGLDPGAPGRGPRGPAARAGRPPPCSTRSATASRACKRGLVRQLPDQAGGRGALPRGPLARDLRHPLPRPGLRPLARPGRRGPRRRRPRRHRHGRARRRCARPAGTATPPPNASARSCWAWRPTTTSAPRGPAGSRSTRWRASTSATAPASSA